MVKQSDKNDETSNISMEISQDDPDDPDVNNVYDFNDGEDPTLHKKPTIVVRLKKKYIFIFIISNTKVILGFR